MPIPTPDCADGFYSRSSDGTKLHACAAVGPNTVAAAGAINDNSNMPRACLENSTPDERKARCLCKAGYYQLVGGQTPRCAACPPASYTDAPNVRLACKMCSIGKVANGDRTACGKWGEVLGMGAAGRGGRGGEGGCFPGVGKGKAGGGLAWGMCGCRSVAGAVPRVSIGDATQPGYQQTHYGRSFRRCALVGFLDGSAAGVIVVRSSADVPHAASAVRLQLQAASAVAAIAAHTAPATHT